MLTKQPPTEDEVRKAFIELVKEYNLNPIEEIKEEFTNIHNEYKGRSSNVFYACVNSVQSHSEITKISDRLYKKYPEFIELWRKYMRLQQEYVDYRISERGPTGVA